MEIVEAVNRFKQGGEKEAVAKRREERKEERDQIEGGVVAAEVLAEEAKELRKQEKKRVKKEKKEVKREEKKKKKKRKRTEEEKEEEEEEEPTSDVENTPPEVSVAPERLAEIKSELKSLFAKYEPVKAKKVNNLLKKYVGHEEQYLEAMVSERTSE